MTWTGRECVALPALGALLPSPPSEISQSPPPRPGAPRARAGPKPSLKEPLLAHV